MVLARAAVEGLAVDAADEVDHHGIAVLGLVGLGRRLEALLLGRQAFQIAVDVLVAGLGHQPFQRRCREVGDVDLRQHLDLDGERQVLVLLHILQVHVRPHGGAHLVVAEHLLGAFADRLLDHLAEGALAVQPLQQGQRRLAGAEALQVDAVAQVLQDHLHALFDLVDADDHLIGALQSLVLQLFNVHRSLLLLLSLKSSGGVWCGRRDLNPHVARTLVPKTSASTNSATPAGPRGSGYRRRNLQEVSGQTGTAGRCEAVPIA